MAPGLVDAVNRQRLYDPTDVACDLRVVRADIDGAVLVVRFSDGLVSCHDVDSLVGGSEPEPDRDGKGRPRPERWTASGFELPTLVWADVLDERLDELHRVVTDLHRFGCFLITGTPAEPGALRAVAARFGRISPTNFGELFDVRSVIDPEDLAYTPVGLAAHTDQPYRRPTPGLQFLHTIENSASGGGSTVVDGLAAIEHLRVRHPDLFAVLASVPVEWRYDIEADVVVNVAPIIELEDAGLLRQLRFSPRLDFPPALDPDLLDAWFLGRRLLAEWFDDPTHRLEFKMEPGDVLVVDNHRVLHGRRPFDPSAGRRHLQGCYIDHDGPATLQRLLDRRFGYEAASAAIGA